MQSKKCLGNQKKPDRQPQLKVDWSRQRTNDQGSKASAVEANQGGKRRIQRQDKIDYLSTRADAMSHLPLADVRSATHNGIREMLLSKHNGSEGGRFLWVF